MDLLEEVNKIGEMRLKEFKSLKDLKLNKKYKIEKMEKVKDKYGPTIIVDLEEYKVHLPKRFVDNLDDKKIKEINKKVNLYLMVTEIKEIKDRETAIIKFVEN